MLFLIAIVLKCVFALFQIFGMPSTTLFALFHFSRMPSATLCTLFQFFGIASTTLFALFLFYGIASSTLFALFQFSGMGILSFSNQYQFLGKPWKITLGYAIFWGFAVMTAFPALGNQQADDGFSGSIYIKSEAGHCAIGNECL